ncbi:MAG: hypothetical protein ACK4WH_11975 [Phycisphaerales bacterium]
MKQDLERAWKLVELGTDDNCDSAATIALAVINDAVATACDRAEAMFMLGQIARFLQPWRCPDNGVVWFRSALHMHPSHIPSMLALCEIAVRSQPMDVVTLDELLPRLQSLGSSMTPGHEKQLEGVRRLAGR